MGYDAAKMPAAWLSEFNIANAEGAPIAIPPGYKGRAGTLRSDGDRPSELRELIARGRFRTPTIDKKNALLNRE